MTSEVSSVADWPLASVTFTVKLDVPAAVGVPDNAPVEAPSVIPSGRLPPLTDQAYGPVPPETANVVEYAVFTSPDDGAGKDSDGAATTVSVVGSVADWPLASVTITVKLDVPAAVGVP